MRMQEREREGGGGASDVNNKSMVRLGDYDRIIEAII